jgi:hypothetical protein
MANPSLRSDPRTGVAAKLLALTALANAPTRASATTSPVRKPAPADATTT